MVQIALKYSKSTYDGKITELRGYLDQLSAHKEKMESLRSQIYDFWYDHNARQVTEVLLEQIRQVENAMQRTNEMLNSIVSVEPSMNVSTPSSTVYSSSSNKSRGET